MIQVNPVIEKQELNKQKPKLPEYPVRICCVVDDLSEASRFTLLKEIKEYAHSSGAIYMTREYDSSKYSDDRSKIIKLPAFHVYIKGAYNRTFYPNTRPLQHIDESVEICIRWEEKKEERRNMWKNWYNTIKLWIKRITHRETMMERYQRESIIQNKKISNWS